MAMTKSPIPLLHVTLSGYSLNSCFASSQKSNRPSKSSIVSAEDSPNSDGSNTTFTFRFLFSGVKTLFGMYFVTARFMPYLLSEYNLFPKAPVCISAFEMFLSNLAITVMFLLSHFSKRDLQLNERTTVLLLLMRRILPLRIVNCPKSSPLLNFRDEFKRILGREVSESKSEGVAVGGVRQAI
ncbi:MAG: hypothetical protein AB1476_03640 [Candidatus Hadarchaeota archaeon]